MPSLLQSQGTPSLRVPPGVRGIRQFSVPDVANQIVTNGHKMNARKCIKNANIGNNNEDIIHPTALKVIFHYNFLGKRYLNLILLRYNSQIFQLSLERKMFLWKERNVAVKLPRVYDITEESKR